MMLRATHSQRGTALVEFAIVLPVLMLLLLGVVEAGRYAYFSILVGNAARAGVQYGAQNSVTAYDTAGMTAAAQADGRNAIAALTVTPANFCQCWNGSTGSAVDCSGTCTTGHLLKYVSVTVSGKIDPLFQYPLLPSSLTVTQTATMELDEQ